MSTENIYAAESVPPRSGMSGTTKLLLGAGAGCFLLVVLACGGFMLFSYKVAKDMKNTDPVLVRQAAGDIVSIDIPAGLEPRFSGKIMMLGSMAKFGDQNDQNTLTLVQLSEKMVQHNDNEATQIQLDQIRTMFDAQSGGGNPQASKAEMEVESTKNHKVEIHGEEAEFTISTGKEKDGREVRTVNGTFKGAGGAAMLDFLGDAEQHSEESLEAMLDSMK